MRKKILVLMSFLFAFAFMFVAIAPKTLAFDNPQDLQDVKNHGAPWGNNNAGNTSNPAAPSADAGAEATCPDNTSATDNDGLFAKLLGTFLYGINGALDALHFPRIDQIIFDGALKSTDVGKTKDDWGFYVFTQDQMNGGVWSLLGMYKGMLGLAWILLIYQVVMTGLKMAMPVRDPAKRLDLQKAIGDMFLATMMVALSWAPFYLFGQVNHLLVSAVGSDSFGVKDLATDVKCATHSGFMTELAVLVFHGLGIVILSLYFMRMFALAILFVLGPLLPVLWLSPSRRRVIGTWLGEVAGNMFLQGIHALLIAVFLALETKSANWWEWIFFAVALIPLGNLVRQLISSLFGGGGDHAVTMAGLAGAGALTGLVALGGQAAGKTISSAGGAAKRWMERKRSEGNPGMAGGISGGGATPGARASGLLASRASESDGESSSAAGPGETPIGVETTAAQAIERGTTGVIGKYSPDVMERAKATLHGTKGSKIGHKVAGTAGAIMGGAVGATLGAASTIIPGMGGRGNVSDMVRSGAQIGRTVLGGAGSAIGGAGGMVVGTIQGVREHFRDLEQSPQNFKARTREIREGLRKALGYDETPSATRTLHLAGGFVGSAFGETGVHVGAAAGHTIARKTNDAFRRWVKENGGNRTLEQSHKPPTTPPKPPNFST